MKKTFLNKKKLKIGQIFKDLLLILSLLILVFLIISTIIYLYISNFAKPYLYSDFKTLPENRVGLVLGTSPRTTTGKVSQFFITRLEAVQDLIKNKKITYIIVSGDNETIHYNEPKYMRNYLLELGINDKIIVSDYGGRRTLDSVLRSSEVFNQNKITIISQKFHNERAIFIARKNGIEAIAYNATYPYSNSPKNTLLNIKVFLRELLARDLAIYDYLIRKKPAILGKTIHIQNESIDGIKRLILDKNIK